MRWLFGSKVNEIVFRQNRAGIMRSALLGLASVIPAVFSANYGYTAGQFFVRIRFVFGCLFVEFINTMNASSGYLAVELA